MKFTVTIDRDETRTWVAECPAIPGCVSQGATKPAALKNVREAIGLCLEVRTGRGLIRASGLTVEGFCGAREKPGLPSFLGPHDPPHAGGFFISGFPADTP